MSKQPAHRPHRRFKNARKVILESEFEQCIHCGEALVLSGRGGYFTHPAAKWSSRTPIVMV